MNDEELLAAWRGPRSRLDRWWRIWLIPVAAVAGFDGASGWAVAWAGHGQFTVIIAASGVVAVAACLWIAWIVA